MSSTLSYSSPLPIYLRSLPAHPAFPYCGVGEEAEAKHQGGSRNSRRMHPDAGLLLPFSQGFLPELAAPPSPFYHHHHLCFSPPDEGLLGRFLADHPSDDTPHMGNLVCTPIVSEYDLGGEGDLFKAPEAIIEDSELALHPMTAAMSIISGEDDVIAETIKVAGMESIQEDSLLSDVFYECKKDLLANSAIEEPLSELIDIKIPSMQIGEVPMEEKIRFAAEGPIQRSTSTGCLNSIDWVYNCTMRPNFLDFQGLDFEAAYGMRRSFSEGDIETLGNNANLGNMSTIHSSTEWLPTISDTKAEERKEKLSRYRNKKSKRNFGRKIKYACRKALADSQPRVRGRFAKTED